MPESRAVAEEKAGFIVRYRSARALKREHEQQISKGGMLVPFKDWAPAAKSKITLRIESPDGTTFDLPATVVTAIRDRGFTVAIDVDPAQKGRSAIDLFMRGDRMKRLVEGERSGGAPLEAEVKPFGAGLPSADPSPPMASDLLDSNDDVLGADTDSTNFDGATDADNADQVDSATDPLDFAGDPALAGLESALADDAVEEVLPAGFRRPQPGEEYLVFVVKYSQVGDFALVRDKFRATQRLELSHSEEASSAGKIAQLRITLPGHNLFSMYGAVERSGGGKVVLAFDENNENFRMACNYVDSPSARSRIKNEENLPKNPVMVTRLYEKVPDEDPEKMSIKRRLSRMGMDDKINMALSGGREERMALATDSNKAIHHYLLRNAKISLDEIAFIARLPTMNPDVLEKIAENTSYTQNPSVVKALVYNPKTPVQTAIRMLDRLPRPELMNLAKRMNMNLRLVMAAKKRLEGRRK